MEWCLEPQEKRKSLEGRGEEGAKTRQRGEDQNMVL